MSTFNSARVWRPICAGARIVNPKAKTPGTLGFIGVDPASQGWLVSCYHVLIRPPGAGGTPFAAGESIYQPNRASGRVAATVVGKKNAKLDVAAALIDIGIEAMETIPTIGLPADPVTAVKGMAVLKAGAATGVTEGVISQLFTTTVKIVPPKDFPADYQLTLPGDSGALWVERDSLAVVAVHRRGNPPGKKEFSIAVRIGAVLDALGLAVYRE